MRHDFRTRRISATRCPSCGHRVAVHRAGDTGVDYHRQYSAGGFLDSLARTRRAQAAAIIRLIRARVADADDVLDFGAGRGWFLEACRAAGMRRLAGADTSADAVTGLRERGIAALHLLPGRDMNRAMARLPFRPRVLTLLDVVEHFSPSDLVDAFAGLVRSLAPELELVVLKVSLADGLLYRISRAAVALGVVGPIEQLYQVGTFPPHHSYFTPSSLERLAGHAGLGGPRLIRVAELDPATAPDRIAALGRVPAPLAGVVGRTLAAAASVAPGDAGVFLAEPTPERPRLR
jgi:methyltransferase family protein